MTTTAANHDTARAAAELLRWVPTGALIGGAWHEATSDRAIKVLDPATEEVIASVPDGSVDEALAAVDAASGALSEWRRTSPRHRSEVLRRAFELMTERAEDIARLMTLENGKALP
ncbi:MAG: aldehyde dehydrogenase family protein, partial [Acidobacteriaceae bacterium]